MEHQIKTLTVLVFVLLVIQLIAVGFLVLDRVRPQQGQAAFGDDFYCAYLIKTGRAKNGMARCLATLRALDQ